jgi:hypothetical protein
VVIKKESHNAIEQRRRDKINDRIKELKDMIPACAIDKAEKASVLHKAIEYIQHIKTELSE